MQFFLYVNEIIGVRLRVTAIKLSHISSLLPAACPQDPEDLCKIAGFRGQSRGTWEKAKSLNLMAVRLRVLKDDHARKK
jgi:hypothetical protein